MSLRIRNKPLDSIVEQANPPDSIDPGREVLHRLPAQLIMPDWNCCGFNRKIAQYPSGKAILIPTKSFGLL
jgi:hypothetical protein